MKCKQCDTQTSNNKFCSRSCAASFNNRKRPKRSVEGQCKRCKEPCTRQRTYCQSCWNLIVQERSASNWDTWTLGEMRADGTANCYSRVPYIRELSRRSYMKSDRSKQCHECGYDLHIEVAHIRAVNDFPDDATVAQINDLNNLIALCRNHHWEFDNGYLEL